MDDILIDMNEFDAHAAWGFDTSAVVIASVIVFGVLFLVIAVLLIKKIISRPELHGLTRERIREKWNEIERVSAQGAMGAKMGVVEADNLLDGVLKSLMMPGETMGERLKVAGYKYPELRNVWFAHKLRNQIVHESTFDLTERQAKAAIHEYQRALKVLNVL
jgi:hypothetical protein